MMSEPNFFVKDHLVLCQHIREEFITSSPDEPEWHMQVKQYTPRNNLTPKEGDITIICSHANGFPKELYEPLWDDLLSNLASKGMKIRNIFVATPSYFAHSSINPANQDGSREPDISRDLLLLVNKFRDTILHPIIGIGHSIGATQLVTLSLMHPSLFTSLILIEPIIGHDSEVGVDKLALTAIKRRREWKTRVEAEKYFSRAWANWDPRVRERWNTSALIPIKKGHLEGATELAWNRLQELTTYMDISELRESADPDSGFKVEGKGSQRWTSYPTQVWDRLEDSAVHTFFVLGNDSLNHGEMYRKHWAESTASNEKYWPRGFERKVELVRMKGLGHLVPLEGPKECAETMGIWIDEEMKMWWTNWEKDQRWRQMGKEEKERAVDTWMNGLKSRI